MDFCPVCGTVVNIYGNGQIACRRCEFKSHLEDLELSTTVTYSEPRLPPQWLVELEKEGMEQNSEMVQSEIDLDCPKCDYPKLKFYTMQLRSADEGQTVFYSCSNCGHKYSENN